VILVSQKHFIHTTNLKQTTQKQLAISMPSYKTIYAPNTTMKVIIRGKQVCVPLKIMPIQEKPSPLPRSLSTSMLSCIVPAYNEQANLSLLLPALQAVLKDLCSNWEVIVVDDGSKDQTALIMSAWCENPGFRFLQLSRNFGKEPAITAGLEAAQGQVIIILDADMQHPPSLIPSMLARWLDNVDMVYAVREHREDESWGKRHGSKLFYRLLSMSGEVQVPHHAGDFRLMDRNVVDALLTLPERNRFMKGLYAWVGFESEALPYTPASREHGQTRFNALKLFSLALTGMMAFTTWPLRALSLIGCLVSICSFSYGLYIIVEDLFFGNPVSGWPTIVTILCFFSGLNMLALGIVGEYIAGIFKEVKGRPLYLLKKSLGSAFKNDQSSIEPPKE
jgi:glycosyltransferase involved in cell wall biosynthesis